MSAISLFVNACIQVPLILPKKQVQKSLTLRWRSFSRWGTGCLAFSIIQKGVQYYVSDYVQPVALQITQVTWPPIVDAPLTIIFRMW